MYVIVEIWSRIERLFSRREKGRPAERSLKVIKTIIAHGFRIGRDRQVYCGDVRIPITSLAEACGVDRRTVRKAIEVVASDPKLRSFFENLEPAGPFLRKVSEMLGYSCLIVETFRDQPGIIASVSSVLAKRGINIVQIVAEDPSLYEEPKLYIIAQGEIPQDVMSEILSNPLIKSLSRCHKE